MTHAHTVGVFLMAEAAVYGLLYMEHGSLMMIMYTTAPTKVIISPEGLVQI